MCHDFKGPKDEDESKDSRRNEFNNISDNVKLIITQVHGTVCLSTSVNTITDRELRTQRNLHPHR